MRPWMERMHPSSATRFHELLKDAEQMAIERHREAERAFLAIGSQGDLEIVQDV